MDRGDCGPAHSINVIDKLPFRVPRHLPPAPRIRCWDSLTVVKPSMAALLVDASERFLGEALARLDEAGYGGLSVSHAFATQLIAAGVTTITALARAMRMTPQAVSAIANQLERKGYVVRARGENDARAKLLGLTEDGRQLAGAIAGALAEVERAWADMVGSERLADVRAALDAYVSAATPAETPLARRRCRRVRIV